MDKYRYIDEENYDQKIGNREDTWKYYSKKTIKKKNLFGTCEVIGYMDVGRINTGTLELNDEEKTIRFQKYEKLNPMLFRTKGYIVCEDGDTQLIRLVEKSRCLYAVLAVALIAAITAGTYWWMNRDTGPRFEEAAIAYKMPEGTPANDDETKIMLPGYGDLPMDADTDELYAALINPEGNQCYFKYKIVLKEGNKTIYESDLIKPGTAVTNVKLNQRITKGTYDINIVVLAYSIEDYKQQLNGGVIETKLISK